MQKKKSTSLGRKTIIKIVLGFFIFTGIFAVAAHFFGQKEGNRDVLSDGVINVSTSYKGIKVKKHKEMRAVKDQLAEDIQGDIYDTEDPIVDGDLITFNYTYAYDGYTEDEVTDEVAQIGNDDFPEANNGFKGFDEQVIGHKVGDSFDIKVGLVEDEGYYEATMHLDITNVSREGSSDLTDEWVQNNTEYQSVDEYVEAQTPELKAQYEREVTEDYRKQVGKKLLKLIEVEDEDLLAELSSERLEEEKISLEEDAATSSMIYEDYLETIGVSEDDLYDEITEDIEIERACDLIANQEGIMFEGETYETFCSTEKEADEEVTEQELKVRFVEDYLAKK